MVLVAALMTYALPGRAVRRAQLVAVLATALAAVLLATELPLVGGGGRIEAAAGALIRGVPFTLRGDQTGVWVALLACAACLVALGEGGRRPLERSALLLCLGGTLGVCLAGGAVLLLVGLEIGNAGALLLALAGCPPGSPARRVAAAGFAVQHLGALGLLAAAVELLQTQGSADLAGLPAAAVTTGVAVPWALCGLARLAAAAGVPGDGAEGASSAWLAVAAVPSGLVVLLRLAAATGGDLHAAQAGAARVLTVAGLVVALAGGLLALRLHRRPGAAARALCTGAAGQVAVLVGRGGPGALTAAAALAVALVLATAAAPAWTAGGRSGPWVRAMALATAACLPTGAGTAAVLAATGVEVAPGGPAALTGALAGITALLSGAAGALAAAAALGSPAGAARREPVLPWIPLAASAVLAVLPGTLLGGIADRIAAAPAAIQAVDSLAVRGPGFGWAGGYLAVGVLLAVVAAASAAVLQGSGMRAAVQVPEPDALGASPLGPAAAMAVAEGTGAGPDRGAVPPAIDGAGLFPEAVAARLGRAAGMFERSLGAVDRWLLRQPDVPVIVIVGVLMLAWFQYRP